MTSIIWSCLATIFLCTWSSYHADLPNKTNTEWRKRAVHALSVLMAFLIPEAVVMKAVAQWSVVRGWKVTLKDLAGWTPVHSHFALMGGLEADGNKVDKIKEIQKRFVAQESSPPPPSSSPPSPKSPDLSPVVDPSSPPEKQESRIFKIPSLADILDKSKGDAMGKLLTVSQTTWFIIDYLGRWSDHQPRTQLEVMTLAYAVLNISIYSLWWNKPLNVEEPIEVSGETPETEGPKNDLRSGGLIRESWHALADGPSGTSIGFDISIMIVVGTLFGGLHCLAWDFPFPTHSEKVLWRVCSMFCTIFPFLVGGCYYYVLKWGFNVLGVTYVIARIILVILTLASLHKVPFGVYRVADWTTHLPHFN